jgi:site-specific DNA-methyltransferase (adenine-specific)
LPTNLLYYGDNLDVLRRHIADQTADLIYLDPPFNSSATYNVLFAEQDGSRAAAQIQAFEDTWRWDEAAARSFEDVVESGGRASRALQSFRVLLGESNLLAYLSMMAPRLLELRRVLKDTGSIYLHCDPTASHYLKVLMDAVFGPDCFRNEIVWRRTGAHGPRKSFGPIHDTILFYTKSPQGYYFRVERQPYMRGHVESRYTRDETGELKFTSGGNVLTGAGSTGGESGSVWHGVDPSAKNRHWAIPGFLTDQMPPEFQELGVLAKLDALFEAGLVESVEGAAWPTPVRYLRHGDGQPIQDVWAYQPYTDGTVYGAEHGIDWDVSWLGPTDPERLGFPTQKPIGLLDRIIRSSCPPDGTVLDPFCGCGTAVFAAQLLERQWIGIDVTHLAITLIRHRLQNQFHDDVTYEVVGEPVSLPDAETLAAQDPYQFQWWALGLVGARPTEQKKGADRGIDGRLYFHDDVNATTKQVVFSVKAGNTGVAHVRDLRGVIEREGAEIGVLITMHEPTQAMRTEAASAGFYVAPGTEQRFPRIQVLTIQELLSGTTIQYPTYRVNVTFRRGPRTRGRAATTPPLPLDTE